MTPLGIILFLLALVLIVVGLIGSVVPVIPGPPLSFCALLLAYFGTSHVSGELLFLMFLLTVAVTVLDYVAPIWFTKLAGGSKKAVWGSTIGLICGLFFMPLGLILGPMIGAFAGEMNHNGDDVTKALKVAAMSLVSFLATTGMKIIVCALLTYYTLVAYFDALPAPETWF